MRHPGTQALAELSSTLNLTLAQLGQWRQQGREGWCAMACPLLPANCTDFQMLLSPYSRKDGETREGGAVE